MNGIKFIERFPDSNPKAYHFAHLFNAVSIIKTRKILSRIRGKGLFENSAGSNVHRRDTAHHYARFYYRPQTPTQYYNEALGEDSHSVAMTIEGERFGIHISNVQQQNIGVHKDLAPQNVQCLYFLNLICGKY